jgi:hypothetical protein
VTIQGPERMSGKIYSNKYTSFLRNFLGGNLNKQCGRKIPGYSYYYFSFNGTN